MPWAAVPVLGSGPTAGGSGKGGGGSKSIYIIIRRLTRPVPEIAGIVYPLRVLRVLAGAVLDWLLTGSAANGWGRLQLRTEA